MQRAMGNGPGVSDDLPQGMPCPPTNMGDRIVSQPNNDKSEPDVESDPKVASSRAGRNDDGDYVGRTGSDDDIDTAESGAEARAEEH